MGDQYFTIIFIHVVGNVLSGSSSKHFPALVLDYQDSMHSNLSAFLSTDRLLSLLLAIIWGCNFDLFMKAYVVGSC